MATLTPLSGTLGEKNAAHLLRRATFGPNVQSIKSFSTLTVTQAMDILFAEVTAPEPPVDSSGITWVGPEATASGEDNGALENYFMIWFLEQMRKSGNSIVERVVFFLHSHLPARRTVIENAKSLYYQNTLFRYYALGDFKTLFKKICIDNAMLVYLDGATNVVGTFNENFAREMLELYSIGKGVQLDDGDYTNYTEDDIKAAAKVLTGFRYDGSLSNIDEDTSIPIGIPNPDLHDFSLKTFSSKFGGATIGGSGSTEKDMLNELDAMITMIFNQDETARFITRKLYRYFVYYDISSEVESNIITPLAANFKAANYDLSTLLKELLSSQHFYYADDEVTSNNNIGAIIKSPIDLMLGTLNFFDVVMPDPETELQKLYENAYQNGILTDIFDQGLSFFEPYEVAGYPAYHQFPGYNRNWITPITLAYRYHFSNHAIKGENGGETMGYKADVVTWVDNTDNVADASVAGNIVTALTNYFLAIEVDPESDRYNYFLDSVFLANITSEAWSSAWIAYASGGADTTIRPILEDFVASLMQTPEFQLY